VSQLGNWLHCRSWGARGFNVDIIAILATDITESVSNKIIRPRNERSEVVDLNQVESKNE
jgi:hypothetical protein